MAELSSCNSVAHKTKILIIWCFSGEVCWPLDEKGNFAVFKMTFPPIWPWLSYSRHGRGSAILGDKLEEISSTADAFCSAALCTSSVHWPLLSKSSGLDDTEISPWDENNTLCVISFKCCRAQAKGAHLIPTPRVPVLLWAPLEASFLQLGCRYCPRTYFLVQRVTPRGQHFYL